MIDKGREVKCILVDPPDVYQKQSANQMHEVYPPLGLLYIAAILKQNGIDVRLIEARSRGLLPEEVIKIVEKENPQFVGITAVTANINSALYLSAKVKEISPDIKVILGGPHIHFEHRNVINNSSVDFCVRGEGELTTLELINSLSNGNNLADVKGITFKQGNEVIITPDRPFAGDLDSLPFPARGLLHHPVYRGEWTGGRPFSPVLATRGCPYLCQFCAAPAIWGRRHRRRLVANVLDELEEIYQEFGVRYVRFVDDLLLVNKKWTIELCRGIVERGLDDFITWVCDGRVGIMSEELLEELKRANCQIIFYGIEFGNQRILDLCKKGFTIDEVRETIDMTSKVGISSYGYFMMGYPTETIDTIEDTINLAKELALDYGMDSAGFSIVTPFLGTPLYEYCKRNHMLRTTDWNQYAYQLQKGVIELENITDKELRDLYERALYEFQFKEKLRQFV